MLHTTFAVTMAEGSAQANVLPSHAEATMSVRILQGDTVESVKKYLESIIPEGVLVKVPFAENPKRAGSTDSDVYELLCDTIHEVYGERQPSCQNSCSAPQTPETMLKYPRLFSASPAA